MKEGQRYGRTSAGWLGIACLCLGGGATYCAIRYAAFADALGPLLLVPYFVGVAASGNGHAPDDTVVWLAFWLLTSAAMFGIAMWVRRRTRGGPT